MARAALPHMKRGSSIVNCGSETGLFGSKDLLDYSATKGAIHAFTKSLASHLLERGIRVNAVAPGPVWTPLNPADKSAKDVADFGKDSDMGRPAQPEEISPAFVFLASPRHRVLRQRHHSAGDGRTEGLGRKCAECRFGIRPRRTARSRNADAPARRPGWIIRMRTRAHPAAAFAVIVCVDPICMTGGR